MITNKIKLRQIIDLLEELWGEETKLTEDEEEFISEVSANLKLISKKGTIK